MTKVLITGGAGFIGSHLADYHLAKGDSVHIIDNLSTGQKKNLRQHDGNTLLTFHHTSLQECSDLPEIVRGVDLVYHMAAVVGVRRVLESPLAVLDSNIAAVDYLFKTLLAHAPKARLLIASSSEVYGLQNNVPFNELDNLLLPSRDPLRWCYAGTKYANEMMVYAYAYEHKLDVTALRLFNTSGPRQSSAYGMVLPGFVEKALRNEDIEVFGDGFQTRSFCDVRDMVMAMEALARCTAAKGITVNLGTDHEISIRDLAQRVIDLTKSKSGIRYISYKEAYGTDFIDVQRRRPDLSRLRQLTGFTSRYSLDDTIYSLAEERRLTC